MRKKAVDRGELCGAILWQPRTKTPHFLMKTTAKLIGMLGIQCVHLFLFETHLYSNGGEVSRKIENALLVRNLGSSTGFWSSAVHNKKMMVWNETVFPDVRVESVHRSPTLWPLLNNSIACFRFAMMYKSSSPADHVLSGF